MPRGFRPTLLALPPLLAAAALAAADLSIPIGAVNSLTGRIVEEGPGPVLPQALGGRKGLLGA